ncbi:fumarate/nitrate reduction transcriptional regulator Fnr [Teredinibacter sp. KSP-S5-2]|uniref:fumarate/nitrate reduction transcriptional regulator Fnr n=1 Tax=Teredinibacter sp. KSP-S5-2 TaxID=3034506 RepID=UPI002934A30E|nr:fumarate/nitrate reduction transcriptional regulator Fnr [Teredinibacter sp. KSP-S5-2]WNO07589.1 fumarate/nitrate reduction transcriptional regulator Fnr [Teredinibacter sp. KSP-S5-2]
MATNVLSAHRCHSNPQVNCADCRLASICLPISLEIEDINKLDDIIQRGRPVQKGDHIYHAGNEFKSVYALRSGAVKTIKVTQDGQEQVTGFYLPGELIGMDGLATNNHSNSAIALETSAVCEIPFTRLEELSTRLPNLQRRFFQLMSKEITHDQQLITLLSKNSADERVASLLLSISTRNSNRGLSANEFYLPMSRSDIGNYLGLTIETVSRVLSRLHKQGMIELDKKHVVIKDMDELKSTASIPSI